MRILVLNCGSSSVKYRMLDSGHGQTRASGSVERVGQPDCAVTHRWQAGDAGVRQTRRELPGAGHGQIVDAILELPGLDDAGSDGGAIEAIGHRVVHGGESFRAPTIIDDAVMDAIRAVTPLSPLHNPANLAGIEATRRVFPQVPQVAVFDTAFHHSLPPRASRYAVPDSLYRDHGVRRYGFHGTSHSYVADTAVRFLGLDGDKARLITLHLGNGASATAIRGGHSIDTSMGMTPLEGLVMGTRCGDLDPAIPTHLMRAAGLTRDEVETLLTRESGLKGLCGENDLRDVQALADGGDQRAALAIEVYVYRIRKYIGAYLAVLGGLDALVFTGGVGENRARIRAFCIEGLDHLGLAIDPDRNDADKNDIRAIHRDGSTPVLVVPTDEELQIARETAATVAAARGNPPDNGENS